MNDREALLAIQKLMDGTQWSADTLEAIAEIMEQAGFHLRPYDGDEVIAAP